MKREAAVFVAVLACSLGLPSCGKDDGGIVSVDPIGHSEFAIENQLTVPVVVAFAYGRNAASVPACSVPGGEIPAGQQLEAGKCSGFSAPLPSEVFTSISARATTSAQSVLVYQPAEVRPDEADLRVWRRDLLKADYPQRHRYTLVLSDPGIAR